MSQRGMSIIELLIAMTILLAILGSVFRLVSPANASAIVQVEIQDMQQRARVVTDTLAHDLRLAGAGATLEPRPGPLTEYLPAIAPAAWSGALADPPGTARDDRLTLTYVPPLALATLTTAAIDPGALRLEVADGPFCPAARPVCGFADGDLLLAFDGTGRFDTFRLDLSSGMPMLVPCAAAFASHYDAGATVVRAVSRTYYRDTGSNEMLVLDGAGAPQPIVDHIVALRFEYTAGDGTPLDGELANGPWSGEGATLFDADLRRVRRVRVIFTIRSGLSGSGALEIPDLTSAFEIALRNTAGGP